MVARRTFLAMAASAMGALGDTTPIGIGFLGASHSHASSKLKAILQSKDWRVVAACESNDKVRQELESLGVKLVSREQLLSDPAIQVIAVESRVADHAPDGKAV